MSAKVAELEAELAGVKGERDARAKEKVEGEKAIEELKQQMSAKVAELEAELAGVKGERDARAKEKVEGEKAIED